MMNLYCSNWASQWRLIILFCALAPLLTACPHHVEKLIDSVAPPKGYKPSYTTSEVSFAKLKQQSQPLSQSREAQSASTGNGSSPTLSTTSGSVVGVPAGMEGLFSGTNGEFDPNILASFPYSSGVGGELSSEASLREMLPDSGMFAMLKGAMSKQLGQFGAQSGSAGTRAGEGAGGMGGTFAMLKGMNLDSMMQSLTRQFPGEMARFDSLQQATPGFDSGFVAALPTSPGELLEAVRQFGEASPFPSDRGSARNSKRASPARGNSPNTPKNTAQTSSSGVSSGSSSSASQKQSAQKNSQSKNSSKSNTSDTAPSGTMPNSTMQNPAMPEIAAGMPDISIPKESMEQGAAMAGAFLEKAQTLAMLYMAKAQALAQERAERERAEAEAYRRIAEEEERAAKKLAEKPPIMPISVDIRSINTKRYPDEVELHVSVMDTAGRFITGLAPPHFQGEGNYRAYWRALSDSSLHTPDINAARVRRFEVTEIREAVQDTHAVAFVLDHSPSMGHTRALRLQEAIARTLGIIKRQDFVSIIKFTKNIKVEVPLTNDTLAYRRGFLIDGLEGYGGGTAMYDGAMAGIHEVMKAPQSATKIVVLFSDGGDNSSKNKLRDVYQLAKKENVRIYTISYGVFDDIQKMQDLATYTGGRLYQLYSSREFPFAFGDVYKSLKNYYRVRYQPVPSASPHIVQLRLAVPELVSVSTATAEYDRSIFTPLDSVGSVQLVNIEFETGKATIQPSSMEQIRDFAQYIKRYPTMVVEVRGHTDDRGAEDLNQKLSTARAEAVATALVQFGVARTQLRTKGFGKLQPLAPNDSEDNRRKNRRTEFAIVRK